MSGDRAAEIWDLAIEAAAQVAAREQDEKPVIAPLTNAAYDEAAHTIEAGIRALKTDALDAWIDRAFRSDSLEPRRRG